MYSVSFTTRREVTTFGPNRDVLSQVVTDIPVVLRNLPRSTAESYRKCDNFSMELEVIDARQEKMGQFKQARSDAFNKAQAIRTERGHQVNPRIAAHKASVQEAAETGDLTAAINEAGR